MPAPKKAKARTSSSRTGSWETLGTRDLLQVRIRDLGLSIEGTWLEDPIQGLLHELDQRGIRFRPHFWLSDEWFVPGDVTGVAIPFYLAHPRLMRLERHQMLEVEGGTLSECRRLLRHETGHVLQNAYQFHRRQQWRKLFGSSSKPYPDYYRPNPTSKRFVQHLDSWYAQAHPDEDFAETFAVWLAPRSNWRKRYAGWPALKKLLYVDELMEELGSQPPRNRNRQRPYSTSRLSMPLGEYYEQKRSHYLPDDPDSYDRDLRRLFPDEGKKGEPAATFLRRHRREVRELVSRWTGEYQFTLDQVLKDMIQRSRDLDLRTSGNARQVKIDFAILLTLHTTNHLYRRDWHPL